MIIHHRENLTEDYYSTISSHKSMIVNRHSSPISLCFIYLSFNTLCIYPHMACTGRNSASLAQHGALHLFVINTISF